MQKNTARKTPQEFTSDRLPPADPVGARFCQWFTHLWDFIFAPLPAAGEKTNWLTQKKYPIGLRALWKYHQDPNELIGLRPGNQTRFGAIDIDRGSEYHPANNFSLFKAVLAALEGIGLCRSVDIRSSDSGGIHVYYFLPELVSSFNLAAAMTFALVAAGFQICKGQLEIFPNVKAPGTNGKKTLYQGLRLPLQAGSYLLDDDLQPFSNDLAQFLDAADVAAAHQDMTALKKALAAAEKNRFKLRFTSVSSDTRKRQREIEEEIAEGWTRLSRTNDLLFRIANDGIFWKGKHGEELVDHIVEVAIKLPGYEPYCQHKHEIRKRAAEVAKSADGNKYWTSYPSYPPRYGRTYEANFRPLRRQNNIVEFPSNQANIERSQQAAQRIQQAVDHLKATNVLPTKVTARIDAIRAAAKELTGSDISPSTLYQFAHKSLWHPGHLKSPEPAQGETLRAVLAADPKPETPEAAQGETLRAVPLYEVCEGEACLSEAPQRASEEAEANKNTHEEGEREGEIFAAALIPAPTEAPQPPTPAALKIPTSADRETNSRWLKIGLAANSHAEKSVKRLALSEGRILGLEERSHRREIFKARFLYESGEPVYVDMVIRWAADHPGSFPEIDNLSVAVPSTGAISPSIPQNVHERKSSPPT